MENTLKPAHFINGQAGSLWTADKDHLVYKLNSPPWVHRGPYANVAIKGILTFTEGDLGLFVYFDTIPYQSPVTKLDEVTKDQLGTTLDKVMFNNAENEVKIAWLPRVLSEHLLPYEYIADL